MMRPAILAGLAAVAISACQTDSRKQVLLVDTPSEKLRAAQSGVIRAPDMPSAVRRVSSTLRSMKMSIDKADADLGIVSATKRPKSLFQAAYEVTIVIRQAGQDRFDAHAHFEDGRDAEDDSAAYREFFEKLGSP